MDTDSVRHAEVFRELSEQECVGLLGKAAVGRVAVTTPDGPVIIPVNYVMDEETVLLRTAPYTLLAAHAWDQVAFEIDDIDHDMQRGRSVLVLGRAAVTDADEIAESSVASELTPWAPGSRRMFIRIRPQRITGREVAF